MVFVRELTGARTRSDGHPAAVHTTLGRITAHEHSLDSLCFRRTPQVFAVLHAAKEEQLCAAFSSCFRRPPFDTP